MEFVGEHPGVGNVAVEGRREDEHHRPQLVTFAAEMLARQAVTKLVQDFDDGHRDAEVKPVLWSEELVEGRQLAVELLEVDADER